MPDLILGLPMPEYEAIKARHKSALWPLISQTPQHYKYFRDHPKAATPAMAFGSAVHTWILERGAFLSRYLVQTEKFDRRTTLGKARAVAFETEAAGRTVLTEADHDKVREMGLSIWANPDAAALLAGEFRGDPEVTLLWEALGQTCKGRIDWLVQETGQIVDLKTTRDASLHDFRNTAASFGYFFQLAFYWDGLKAVLGRDPADPQIIAVETEPPFACAVYRIPARHLELGRKQYLDALAMVRACEEADAWPGYPSADLIPKKWMGLEEEQTIVE